MHPKPTEYNDDLLPQKPDPLKSLFVTMSAHEWLRHGQNEAKPKMLFGEFWYENELAILFADTNVGKSVLAVQIGNSLAANRPIGRFRIEAAQLRVAYIDFELSGRQFRQRYTNDSTDEDFDFDVGFYRLGFNPTIEMPATYNSFDDYIDAAIEYHIKSLGANVLIIDNITCLRGGTQNTADALAVMKKLKSLKTRLQISILVLAHTPKRNAAKPITRNDLQGSKMLINFADSAFAMAESHCDPGLRYLKQVKQRATQLVYGEDNVCLCRITKPANGLQFDFEGTAHEREHLRPQNRYDKDQLTAQITQLTAQGLSQRQISAKLNVGLGTVNRVVNKADEKVA
jgi:DNA-binding NarL/FixJ family response regulator